MTTNLAPTRFALLLMYCDRSGIQAAFGPFPSEEAADRVKTELQEVGLDGLWEVHPLRDLAVIAGAVSRG